MTQTEEPTIVTCEKHGEYSATLKTMIYGHGEESHKWTTPCPSCEQEWEERRKRQDEKYVEERRRKRI